MTKKSSQMIHEDSKKILLRLLSYILKDRKRLSMVIISIVISTGLTVYAPTLLGHIVDRYILKKDISGTLEHVFYLALIYLAVSALTWIEIYIMIQISVNVVRTMRWQLYEKFQVLPPRYHRTHRTGDLMSRLTNDLDNLSTALSQNGVPLISSILTILGTIIAMLILSWKLALISFLILPCMFYVSKKIIHRSSADYVERQHALGEMNAHINEQILGAEVVTLFGQEKTQWQAFNERNQRYKRADFRAEVVSSSLAPINRFLNNVALALIIGAGAIMTVQGTATIGTIASFTAYSRQFFRPIEQLSSALNSLQAAYAGVKRVFEVLDEKNEFEQDAQKSTLSSVEKISVKNLVANDLKGRCILHDVSLDFPVGKRIALIGPSGAGKTALLNHLNGFETITSGQVLINDRPIEQYKKSDVRKRVNSVLEDVYLFTGSIADNIRISRPSASDEEVIEAAKKVHAHPFIECLPDKYHTMIHSNGENLSQGERQLIAIARAVIARPDVLILDQALACFNIPMNIQILKALQEATTTKTLILSTHELKLMHAADLIFVLKDGGVVQQGTHNELVEEKGFYNILQSTQSE